MHEPCREDGAVAALYAPARAGHPHAASAVVGVHHHNRDHAGIDVSHVQRLISDIVSLGYVPSKAHGSGIALEIPSDEHGNECRQFNERLAENSDERLAPCDGAKLRYASVQGKPGVNF